jgi:vacuole morphology and inheritance protein 14
MLRSNVSINVCEKYIFLPCPVSNIILLGKLQIYDHLAVFEPALLKILADPEDRVVLLALEMLAELSTCQVAGADPMAAQSVLSPEASAFFGRLVVDLLSLFRADRALLDTRGTLIIRQLCLLIRPEHIYTALAAELLHEEDLEFARLMVQTLNLILLTATELHDLRSDLKALATPQAVSILDGLYRSWSHSPVSVLSLCLLCQVYDHACALLARLADLEVTVAFLTEVDKLVQLLESPIFTHLRLQLLEPQRHAHLIKALYGLLMLLPQCRAYTTLKARLDCIPTIIHALVLLEDPS